MEDQPLRKLQEPTIRRWLIGSLKLTGSVAQLCRPWRVFAQDRSDVRGGNRKRHHLSECGLRFVRSRYEEVLGIEPVTLHES